MAAERPLRTIIVDDEPLAVERLTMLCAALDDVTVVGTANDGEAVLRLIERTEPDLTLLDISMPELDGIAVARALETSPGAPAIVFCTAFDNFAVEAFEVAAADYLLKPVTHDKLARAVARVAAKRTQAAGVLTAAAGWADAFWVPHRGELLRIAAVDIDRIEADRDYMRLYVGARQFLLHQTISRLERRLDPKRFIRFHRSHIVQRNRIERLAHDRLGIWTIHMTDGTALRVGRSYLAAVRRMTAHP